MKFDDVPRLPKLPFIVGDLVLLILAWVIADQHPKPFTPLPLFLIAGCVVIACVLVTVPYLVNYVRDREEAATSLRRELTEQFKRLMTASEHLQNATAQLKTAEEVAAKNLQAAEQLPFRMQEKVAEFTQQLAGADRTQKEATEQELATLRSAKSEHLATISDRIVKAAGEYTKLEGAARRQLDAAAQLEPKLVSLLSAIDARITALSGAVQMADRLFSRPPFPAALPESIGSIPPVPPAPAATPAPAASSPAADAAPPPAASASRPPLEPIPAAAEPAAPEPAAPEPAPAPRKPRAPRKPKAEEPAAAGPAAAPSETRAEPAGRPAPDLIVEPIADEPPAPDDFSQVPPDENKSAAVPSADGFTRLTVVSYIGIGNKLYLRGEGPGLSWDKGVPLQFVSIGRWRWETDDAAGPVACKVYKNDKIEAPFGQLTLAHGTEQEITAAF